MDNVSFVTQTHTHTHSHTHTHTHTHTPTHTRSHVHTHTPTHPHTHTHTHTHTHNLSWKDHVDQVCLKVNRKIGALRRSFRQLTPTARQAFFLSVIQPDLEYAASAIVPSMAVSPKNRLLATWRRAVQCAAGSVYQDNVTPLVKQLKIVSLEHRWALQVAEIVFRCNHGFAPSALKDKLRRNNHGARTRGSKESYLPYRSSSLSGELSCSTVLP